MSKEPLDEIQWKNPEWIQHFGLHTGNVLDYFSESPFYDRTSNNQVLRMQFQFQQVPPGTNPSMYMQQKLREMTGIEFIVAFYRDPDFWIIRKQRRFSQDEVQIQQDYYIIGANVYQAPKIYEILSSRLLFSVLSLKKSVDLLSKMSKFSISDGTRVYRGENVDTSNNTDNNTVSNSIANTGSMMSATPMLLTPAVASSLNTSGQHSTAGPSCELLEHEFNSLLNNVVSASNEWTYLDDIPLNGKGSTLEMLALKTNSENT